jgi:phosphate/sulfate permease
LADRRWIGYGYLSAVSPVGTLVWAAKGGVAVWVGLAFQALLAVGATLLGRRVRQRLGRTEAPPMPVGSVAVAS